MTVANLVGIPVGTYLSRGSWRYTFIDRGFQHRCAHRDFSSQVPDIRMQSPRQPARAVPLLA